MEWKFFQLWAKAGCGMYVNESKRQRVKETKRQEKRTRTDGPVERPGERQRETES